MNELVQRRKVMAEEMMRNAICDAAAAVLAEVGFAAFTMERVAETVGASKGTLYNYFRDKDTLVMEVAERTHAPLREETDRIFAEETDIPRALLAVVRVILTGVAKHRALGRVLCSRELSPGLTAQMFTKRLLLRRLLEDAFRRAASAGLLRFPCEHPENLGRCLALALHGMIDLQIHHPEDCPPIEQEIEFVETCLIRPWFREA